MGRIKIFDETAALEQATRLFWEQGYANTSIKQLLTKMDMLNGSFYHCFKDKKTLFLRSLEYYNQEILADRISALESEDDFSLGIRAFFAEIFKSLKSRNDPNGCLIVNSTVEEVLCEKELKEYLIKYYESYLNFLVVRLQHSIDMNYTSVQLTSRQLALILMTYIQGLYGMSRASTKIKQLETQTEDFLRVLHL